MAYQDGFYSAADLYVSIPLSPLLPHSSPTFSPSCLWVFKCDMARTKPIEMCTFRCFDSTVILCFPDFLILNYFIYIVFTYNYIYIQLITFVVIYCTHMKCSFNNAYKFKNRSTLQHTHFHQSVHSRVDFSRVCLCAFVSLVCTNVILSVSVCVCVTRLTIAVSVLSVD